MEMEMQGRKIVHSHPPTAASPKGGATSGHTVSQQGIATLVVMLVVLSIIVMFCCFAAPGIRSLCRRFICRTCPFDDPDVDNSSAAAGESPTPTVILLPYGRMLVVDRTVFAQLQADHTGIDFMELSASLIRTQAQPAAFRRATLPLGSTPSILDSDTTSKGISPTSLGFSPPAYDDIFGSKSPLDLPPSYSEVSLMLKLLAPVAPPPPPAAADGRGGEDIEMRGLEPEAARNDADCEPPRPPAHTAVDIPETISAPYRGDDSNEYVYIDESVL